MTANITLAPFATNQPASSFLLQSQGYVQGTAYDDPSVRMELAGGTLATAETLVMWGGVPLTEQIDVNGSGSDGLGPVVARATSQANTTGWSVYNQAGAMVIGPGNSAPVSGTGGFVAFFRNGSNIRIAVQCDPALITSITGAGDAINSQALYWDTTNYRITLTTSSNWALPTSVKLLSTNSNSKIISYNSGTGVVSWTTGSAAIILI